MKLQWARSGQNEGGALADVFSRAAAYVAAMPPAIAGSRGHDATFAVVLALCHGFALSKTQARPIMQEFNARCDPPWSEKELEHKLESAEKAARPSKPRGHLLGERGPRQSVPAQKAESPAALTIIEVDTSEPLPAPFLPPAPRLAGGRPEVSAPSRTTASECHTPQLSRGDEIEARRIAGELDRLHRDGAIASKSAHDLDAVFYARLLRDFGATCTGRSGPRQNAPKILPDGEFAPRPAAENQWKVPDPPPGLNWAERQKFYMDDLRDAIGDEWIPRRLAAPPRAS